jgi:hypothetical protein
MESSDISTSSNGSYGTVNVGGGSTYAETQYQQAMGTVALKTVPSITSRAGSVVLNGGRAPQGGQIEQDLNNGFDASVNGAIVAYQRTADVVAQLSTDPLGLAGRVASEVADNVGAVASDFQQDPLGATQRAFGVDPESLATAQQVVQDTVEATQQTLSAASAAIGDGVNRAGQMLASGFQFLVNSGEQKSQLAQQLNNTPLSDAERDRANSQHIASTPVKTGEQIDAQIAQQREAHLAQLKREEEELRAKIDGSSPPTAPPLDMPPDSSNVAAAPTSPPQASIASSQTTQNPANPNTVQSDPAPPVSSQAEEPAPPPADSSPDTPVLSTDGVPTGSPRSEV